MPGLEPGERDVIVVGGGPAGSVTASLLARAGHDVLLLERHTFPRPKPCGESINPGAVRQLEALGLLPMVVALPHQRISGWDVAPAGESGFRGRFPDGAYGLAIDRGAFDDALLGHARDSGAAVETGVRVTEPLVEQGRVVGVAVADGRRIGARLVVGADGLRSVIVRRLGLAKRRAKLRKVALTAHVTGVTMPATTGVLRVTPWGCIGITRLAGGLANVVIVLERESIDEARGNAEGCFDRKLRSCEFTRNAARTTRVMATGPFDQPIRSVTADGALLVGDAAGYFDPLTGQGIHRALLGARHAASVAECCLRRGPVTQAALRPYAVAHGGAFAAGVRVQRAIEATVSRPTVFRAAASALRARPRLADALVAVTGDLRPVRSLVAAALTFHLQSEAS